MSASTAAPDFAALFEAAGCAGWMHALDLQTGAEVGHGADTPVIAASVFKVPVLVELFRQADAGRLAVTERLTVPVAGRAPGPTGLSMMQDPVRMSLQDLALSMIVVSDNAATDVLCEKVGLSQTTGTMCTLGLPGTVVSYDCRELFAQMAQDAGVASFKDIPRQPDAALLERLRALDAPSTNRTTPREICRLMAMIWNDEAASAASCAQMRRILLAQVWPHRLASGFPEDDIQTAGKTGTLPLIRNEAGMVILPDGRRIAVGVFTRAHRYSAKNPAQDAVIGRAARAAVDALLSRHA